MAYQDYSGPEKFGFDALIKLQNKAVLWMLGLLSVFFVVGVGYFLFLRNVAPAPLYEWFPFGGLLACGGYSGVENLHGDARIFYSNAVNGSFLLSVLLSMISITANKNIIKFCFILGKYASSENHKKSDLIKSCLYNAIFSAVGVLGFCLTIDNSCRKFIRHEDIGILIPSSFGIYALTVLTPLFAISFVALVTGVISSIRKPNHARK